jgi:hypothetical protein
MCFSDEPMIAIYGEFESGSRLLYITEEGPRFFPAQSAAIDQPLADSRIVAIIRLDDMHVPLCPTSCSGKRHLAQITSGVA